MSDQENQEIHQETENNSNESPKLLNSTHNEENIENVENSIENNQNQQDFEENQEKSVNENIETQNEQNTEEISNEEVVNEDDELAEPPQATSEIDQNNQQYNQQPCSYENQQQNQYYNENQQNYQQQNQQFYYENQQQLQNNTENTEQNQEQQQENIQNQIQQQQENQEIQNAEEIQKIKESLNFAMPDGIKEVLELQKKLDILNKQNFDQIVEQISKTFNNKERYECLAQTINFYSTIRYMQQPIYAEFAAKLVQNLPGFSEILLQESHGVLLRRLYDLGIYSKEMISKVCETHPTQYLFFANEIRITQRGQYAKAVAPMMPHLSRLSRNNWSLYKDMLYSGFDNTWIQYTIQVGNIDMLIKYSNHPHFNIEQKYSDSPFCPFNEYKELYFSDRPRYTLLAIAAFFGQANPFKYLLNFNPIISNDVCKCAVRGGNVDIIRMCKERSGNFEGCHAIAIYSHRNDVYDYLQNNVFLFNPTLSIIASSGNLLALFQYLQKNGGVLKIGDNDKMALHDAVKKGHEFMVRMLIENGFDPTIKNNNQETPIHIAAKKTNVELAKYLIEKGCDPTEPNNQGWTPLHNAATHGHIRMMKLLIEHGADINAKTNSGFTVIHIALRNNQVDTVIYLLNIGANPNSFTKEEKSPLCLAILKHFNELAKLLIEHGAEVNPGFSNESPISVAYHENNQEMIDYLLSHGAIDLPKKKEDGSLEVEDVDLIILPPKYDIKKKDQFGRTLLMLVCQTGQIDLVKKLVAEYSDINDRDCNGMTPLMIAIQYDHPDVALFLIQRNAQLNVKAKNGKTPLHLAVLHEMFDVVTAMKKKGVFMNPSSRQVGTPLSLAKSQEMKDLISSYGGV